jgi:hypothetical protein
MVELQAAAEAIEAKLALANSVAWEIDWAAHSGSVVSNGTVDKVLLDQQIVTAYNGALENVINASYLTAADVLATEHNVAIDNMHTAIDNLVEATSVLATVSTVADMAESATTTEQQMEVQVAITNTDMSIDQQDVDNFNNALTDVQTFAQQAGAFLAAANDTGITEQIDSFTSQNNIAMSSYTAINYVQDVDKLMVSFDQSSSYISFSGYMTNYTKTVEEIYDAVGYNG